MEMYLISDNVDTYTGMRLAGVDGVVVHQRDELKEALDNVLLRKEVGIDAESVVERTIKAYEKIK